MVDTQPVTPPKVTTLITHNLIMSALTEVLKEIEKLANFEKFFWRSQLTQSKIDEILGEYPFQLSEEVYELYLWQNGATTNSSEENYESLDFINLGSNPKFLPLEEAMDIWKNKNQYSNLNESSKIFPLFNDEYGAIVVLGREEQERVSPVYIANGGWSIASLGTPSFPSITNMILAASEVRSLNGIDDEAAMCEAYNCIEKKYGGIRAW